MRTLTRPMFNMGGPIKQGIMHGIREPYRGGGQAALVGNPLYPRTGGREHHGYTIPLSLGWAALQRMLGGQAVKQVGQKVIGSAATGEMAKKGIQESIKRAALHGYRYRNCFNSSSSWILSKCMGRRSNGKKC